MSQSDERGEPVLADFLSSLRTFVPVALHDLRGRFNNLNLKLELQLARGADPSWVAPLRDQLRDLAEELGRGFAPVLPHDHARFDLVEVARETCELVEPWARRSSLRVERRFSDAVPIEAAGNGEVLRTAWWAALGRLLDPPPNEGVLVIGAEAGARPALSFERPGDADALGPAAAWEAAWDAAGARADQDGGRLRVEFERTT